MKGPKPQILGTWNIWMLVQDQEIIDIMKPWYCTNNRHLLLWGVLWETNICFSFCTDVQYVNLCYEQPLKQALIYSQDLYLNILMLIKQAQTLKSNAKFWLQSKNCHLQTVKSKATILSLPEMDEVEVMNGILSRVRFNKMTAYQQSLLILMSLFMCNQHDKT